MKTSKEIKYLESVNNLKEKDNSPIIFKPFMPFLIMLILGIVFSSLKMFFETNELNTYVFMFLNVLIGLIVGMYFFYAHAYRSWFILKPYINFERIEKTINEHKT